MDIFVSLLRNEINELIAIIITAGNYGKNFYEGILRDVNDNSIVLEIAYEKFKTSKLGDFILATPLDRYH